MPLSAYSFWLRALSPIGRLIFRVKYLGVENIPPGGALILCSNHKSVVDPFLLAVPFRRQVRYMAKSELYDDHGRFANWFLNTMGAFPVRRDKADAESLRTAVDLLAAGGVVGIFAQGRCVFDDSPFQPKAGVALVAKKACAPILPASIYCDGVLKPFQRVTVRFGPVIPFEELGLSRESLRDVRAATGLVAQRVNAMLEQKHEGRKARR